MSCSTRFHKPTASNHGKTLFLATSFLLLSAFAPSQETVLNGQEQSSNAETASGAIEISAAARLQLDRLGVPALLQSQVTKEINGILKEHFEPVLKPLLGPDGKVSVRTGRTFVAGETEKLYNILRVTGDSPNGNVYIVIGIHEAHDDYALEAIRKIHRGLKGNLDKPLEWGNDGARSAFSNRKFVWLADDGHFHVQVRTLNRNGDVAALAKNTHLALKKADLYNFRKRLLGKVKPAEPAEVEFALLDINAEYIGSIPNPHTISLDAAWPQLQQGSDADRAEFFKHFKQEMFEPDFARSVVELNVERRGVAADGVSRLLVRVRLPGPGRATFSVKEDLTDGSLDDPTVSKIFLEKLGTKLNLDHSRETIPSVKVGDEYYTYLTYIPPDSFGESKSSWSAAGTKIPETRKIDLAMEFFPASGSGLERSEHTFEFDLARPPVVLVHGTFDNPRNCWQTSAREAPASPERGDVSMQKFLQMKGFATYLVDFSSSNGRAGTANTQTFPPTSEDGTSFRANSRVVFDKQKGGIEAAIDDYRRNKNLAVTQADVVGHSLGGLLARVWASETDEYVAAKQSQAYRRPANFYQGDINRLITIASPHHGSDIAGLFQFMFGNEDAPPRDLRASLVKLWLRWKDDMALTSAVRDQLPKSWALRQIGPTRAPSHAIVCIARWPDLKDFEGVYLKGLADFWKEVSSHRVAALEQYLESKARVGAAEKLLAEIRDRGWLTNEVPAFTDDDQKIMVNLFRGAVYDNSRSDLTVREESQIGGLPMWSVSTIEGVLHSFAPRYRQVQQRVADLLSGDGSEFSVHGFPPAGQEMVDHSPVDHGQDPTERQTAVTTSGLVPSHAEAFSYIAQRENTLIITRPVNHHATGLIKLNLATKDMHVKGKSSNWGPQKGLIAVRQRYSKLFCEPDDRQAEIRKFNAKVQECLTSGRAVAVDATLTHDEQTYEILRNANVNSIERAPTSLILRNAKTGRYHDWKTFREIPAETVQREDYVALQILADRFSRKPLTADYDFLAIAPLKIPGPGDPVTPVPQAPTGLPFDTEMGAITEFQKQVLSDLNVAVRIRGRYTGGNVVHHGPETQYSGSPGIDYPLTAFHPSGRIDTIPEGPPGREDLPLKIYFHHQVQAGYDVYPNPVWEWGEYDPAQYPRSGWDPRAQKRKPDLLETRPADDYFDSDEGSQKFCRQLAP